MRSVAARLKGEEGRVKAVNPVGTNKSGYLIADSRAIAAEKIPTTASE